MPAQPLDDEFFESIWLPPTPNPLVNQAVDQLFCLFCRLWMLGIGAAMFQGAMALHRSEKQKRGEVFIREWESWQRFMMDQIEPIFDMVLNIGGANPDCALPDPVTWAYDSMRNLIWKNLSWPASGEHIVDEWVKY